MTSKIHTPEVHTAYEYPKMHYSHMVDSCSMAITAIDYICAAVHHQNFLFSFLFIFRYLRLIVHIISFWLYKPTPITGQETLTGKDCTIIIPTVDPQNEDFNECITSVLANSPGAVLIVTVGNANRRLTEQIIAPFRADFPDVEFQVTATNVANKRQQVAHAIPEARTAITVLVDDHVFWPSTNFLRTLTAPFSDPQVGVVGTNKRVRRFHTRFGIRSFWNMIGALYLERHNFEIRATNAVDGGVFVISGRTGAHRTCILQDPAFLAGFTNESFFFGKFGPLNADDDNFITRWEVSHGWKIKIQYCQDAMIETTLGTYPKFLSQCRRWVQTTWRSNSASLFTDRTVWRAQPWCVYAVYITSFVNFALFYDTALVYTLTKTTFGNASTLKLLAAWIFASKMIKLFPYFCRHPADLIYLPGYFIFAYYHSLVKLYALLTFWDVSWGGRNLAAIGGDDDDEDDSDGGDHGPGSPPNGNPDDAPCFGGGSDNDNDDGNDDNNNNNNDDDDDSSGSFSTPWGPVRPTNLHIRPGNVLETQLRTHQSPPRTGLRTPTPPSDSSRAPPRLPKKKIVNFGLPTPSISVSVSPSPAPRANRRVLVAPAVVLHQQPVNQRTWLRAGKCGRQHSDGHNIIRQRCVLGNVGEIGLQ